MTKEYQPFGLALKKGHLGENNVITTLQNEGVRIGRVKIRDNSADFECTVLDCEHSIEVKNEDRYAGSGNICIEMYQGRRPRPSGILASKATICIHTFGEIFACYPRIDMVTLVKKWEANGMQLQAFGDNCNKGYITSRPLFITQTKWYFETNLNDVLYCRIWQYYIRTHVKGIAE
jgi:hypothetical protein